MASESKWINDEEAAEMMGIKPQTLRAWRSSGREGQPTFYKSGNLVRYKRADVEAWVESTAVSY